MTLRTFGLVAVCMLAGTISASAQNIPDQGKGKKESPGKVEMPSREGGKSAREPRSKELTSKPSSGPQKSESSSSQRGRDRSAQDLPKKQDVQKNKQSYRAEDQKKKGSSAQNDLPKAERGKPDDKASKEDKQEKAAQSKSESKPTDKSSSESKAAPADANKSAEREKSKADETGRDSASGASTGEAGAGSPGKVTEDPGKVTQEKKKVDEVKNVQITGERRDRVQAGFRRHGDIKHETNVDVNIFVGTRVPRSWAFAPVPIAVIEVVPEYRGYVFAYVEDEYVICDPDTYEVVAVLPASSSGGTYAGREGGGTVKCPTDLVLSDEDRGEIIKSIELTDDVSISGVNVGWSVPSDIELRPFPPRVVERTSGLGACRYFITNDQIAIVDPDQDEVVLMIEQD